MTNAAMPTLHVRGALTDALTPQVLAQLRSEQLAAFLLQRRWFGGKGRAPTQVRIGDVVEVDRDGVRAAVVRLDVDLGGRTAYYQLPLAVRREDHAEPPGSVLARVEGAGERGVLFDAVEDERFRATLGSAFAAGARLGGTGGSRLVIERVTGEGTGGRDVGGQPSRTVRAEQSNTSIIFGDVAIMKLFRRLEPGINPDVEIGRFLTRKTHFTHTPPLLGVVRYEGSASLESVAGMLQGFLPGSSDAWQYALEKSRGYFAAHDDDGVHPFAADAERLGRITRELHDALASARDDEAFVPRKASRADVERWAASARERIEDATTLIAERLDSGQLADARSARVIVDDRDGYIARLDELVSLIGDDAWQLIRHHGDYHLGQVLRTRDGDFQVIDFEGEPARPLAERRARNSALRDVAGMLRSFAYAAATLAAEQGERAARGPSEQRAAAWERGAREAFLDGYMGEGGAAFLPATPQRIDALRELFETEKVFYEMSYELNNRPDWVWIPVAGACALRSAPAARS